jgi:hypothetical protein
MCVGLSAKRCYNSFIDFDCGYRHERMIPQNSACRQMLLIRLNFPAHKNKRILKQSLCRFSLQQTEGLCALALLGGQSFEEEGLRKEGSFKAAEARFTAVDQIEAEKLKRWLTRARDIQWDYKNLIRRKGRLERLN